MFIHYKLYRSKTKEVYDEGKVQFNIENDDHLIAIDDIMTSVMTNYINSTEEVKKYGIAYIEKMEVPYIEITDEDKLGLSKEEFHHYMSTINPNMQIIWNRKETFNPNL